MRRSIKAGSLIGVLLVTLSLPAGIEGRHLSALIIQEFRERLVAPTFTLPTLSDGPVSLKQFRGSFVLLNFWATWCPPCLAEMPDLERLHRDLKAEGLVVVAVSIDTQGKKAVAPVWEKADLSFPSLLDPSGKVATRYGVRVLPTSFLITPGGEIIGRILGPREWHSQKAQGVFRSLLPRADPSGGGR